MRIGRALETARDAQVAEGWGVANGAIGIFWMSVSKVLRIFWVFLDSELRSWCFSETLFNLFNMQEEENKRNLIKMACGVPYTAERRLDSPHRKQNSHRSTAWKLTSLLEMGS